MATIVIDPTTLVRTWVIILNKEEMFSRVSIRSVYINNKLSPEQRAESREMLEDDRIMFGKYFGGSVADLIMLLTRNFSEEFSATNIDADGNITLTVFPTTLMPDSIVFPLEERILQYIESYCLSKWLQTESGPLGIDAEFSEAQSKLLAAIHYRRKGLRRPIDPLF